jgi:hypothetical protein
MSPCSVELSEKSGPEKGKDVVKAYDEVYGAYKDQPKPEPSSKPPPAAPQPFVAKK